MTERVEQRICIKFYQKNGYSCSETINLIRKAFGDDSMSKTQIKEWFRRFKDGRSSVESLPRSGRPASTRTPENIERVRNAINENPRLTVRELEEDLRIPKTIVSEILTQDLGMRCEVEKFVFRLPTQEQKDIPAEIVEDNLDSKLKNSKTSSVKKDLKRKEKITNSTRVKKPIIKQESTT